MYKAAPQAEWKCQNCAGVNPLEAETCIVCGTRNPQRPPEPQIPVVKQCPSCRIKILNAEGIPVKLAICTNCGAPLYPEHFQGTIACPTCKKINSYSPVAISPHLAVCGTCRNPLFPKVYNKPVSAPATQNHASISNTIITVAVMLVVAYFLFNPGGYFAKEKALGSVKEKKFSITTSSGQQVFTVDQLIHDYNFRNNNLMVGGIMKDIGESTDLKWQTQYLGGKFAVGCEYGGHSFTFETDTMNVTPTSDDAKVIFDLQNRAFTEPPNGLPMMP